MKRVYLDHNATSPPDPRVLLAMEPWLREHSGNPSSLYAEGRLARRAVEDARDEIAQAMAVPSREITFTSGATEANTIAVFSAYHHGRGALVASAIEHPSILASVKHLGESTGRPTGALEVDETGLVRLDSLYEALEQAPALLALMAVNNEVGSIQPIDAVARQVAGSDTWLHVDAVQAWGKADFGTPPPGVSSLSISGHKIGASKGIGALWCREEFPIAPLFFGGGQERGRRAGTENVAGIVGLGRAVRLAREEISARQARLAALEAEFLGALRQKRVDFERHGPSTAALRIPGTLNLRFPGVRGERLMIALDLDGVAISLGSACSSGAAEPSPVLRAMGVEKLPNLESVRISFGATQALGEGTKAAQVIHDVLRLKLNS